MNTSPRSTVQCYSAASFDWNRMEGRRSWRAMLVVLAFFISSSFGVGTRNIQKTIHSLHKFCRVILELGKRSRDSSAKTMALDSSTRHMQCTHFQETHHELSFGQGRNGPNLIALCQWFEILFQGILRLVRINPFSSELIDA